jgi:hypothetical protein
VRKTAAAAAAAPAKPRKRAPKPAANPAPSPAPNPAPDDGDAKISLPDITARLLAIAALGEANGAGPMLSLARAALMDAARLNGLAEGKPPGGPGIEDLLQQLEAGGDERADQPGDAEAP